MIVAHCAAPYTAEEPNYVPEMKRLLCTDGWNVYADISALLLGPIRGKAMAGFFETTDPARLVYGSDFPIPTLDLTFGSFHRPTDLRYYLHAAASSNWLDIDVLLKRAYGVPSGVFTNTATVLGIE